MKYQHRADSSSNPEGKYVTSSKKTESLMCYNVKHSALKSIQHAPSLASEYKIDGKGNLCAQQKWILGAWLSAL